MFVTRNYVDLQKLCYVDGFLKPLNRELFTQFTIVDIC